MTNSEQIKLKRLRVNSFLSQKQVSNELGITQAYLSMIECGKRKPSQQLKRKIDDYFNCIKLEEVKPYQPK